MIADFFKKLLAGTLFKKFRNIIQCITQEDMPKYKRVYNKATAAHLTKELDITNKVNSPHVQWYISIH